MAIHRGQKLDQGLGAVPILHGGWSSKDRQDQSQALDRNVPFAPRDLLACVIATFSALVGSFHRLAIDDCRRGGNVARLEDRDLVNEGR